MTTKFQTTSKVRELTGTRKKEFRFTLTETVRPVSGWSGGSRSSFHGMNFRTGATVLFKQGDHWSVSAETQPLPQDVILIETGTFCGKPAIVEIHANPADEAAVRAFLGIPFCA